VEDLGGLAIVASALGHIMQTPRSAELEREKARLLGVLRSWQQAHRRAVAQLLDLQQQVGALQRTNETLREQLSELERDNVRWESDYAKLLAELDEARGGVPQERS